MSKKMPDLFVVMSSDELVEAVSFAKEQGAVNARVFEAIDYELKIGGVDVGEFVFNSVYWFPPFTEYVDMPISDEDSVGILLSPTVWNEYDDSLLSRTFDECAISYQVFKNSFVDYDSYKKFKEDEKQASLVEPINSPWTARDIEVVEAALDNIENIKDATVIIGANVNIRCYQNLLNGSPIPTRYVMVNFNYPNVLHLESDNGYYNVFMGEDIDVKNVLELTQKKNISSVIKEYSEDDNSILLYQPRKREKI